MRYTTREVTYIAMFVALSILSVYIARIIPAIPILGVGVPLSFMPLISALSGMFLGVRGGVTAMVLYMMMGLIGLPVFAGGSGGPGSVFSPTFGFIIGYSGAALVAAIIFRRRPTPVVASLAALFALAPIYVIGIVYMDIIMHVVLKTPATLLGLTLSMTPFLIKDIVVNTLIGALASTLIRRLPSIDLEGQTFTPQD
ncbi:MAG: biotin transporter BioY [Candidatus Carbobacillus sp.]|nr:biotin transporter BioY [Candidatus Carbobacillus sp.]